MKANQLDIEKARDLADELQKCLARAIVAAQELANEVDDADIIDTRIESYLRHQCGSLDDIRQSLDTIEGKQEEDEE